MTRGRGLFKRTKAEKMEKAKIEALKRKLKNEKRIRTLEAKLQLAKQECAQCETDLPGLVEKSYKAVMKPDTIEMELEGLKQSLEFNAV